MKIPIKWLARHEQPFHSLKLCQKRRVASVTDVAKVTSGTTIRKRKHHSQVQPRGRGGKHTWLRHGTRKDFVHTGTFQEAIKPVVVLAQVFALMPVVGVTSSSVHDLHFTWLSLRTVYSVVVIVCFAFSSGFALAFAFRDSLKFDSVETIIFYSSIVVIASAFLKLARKWPALLVEWDAVERALPPLRTERERAALAYRIKMITLVATICSLIEHVLSMLSIIYYVNACPHMPGNPIESFLYTNFSQFFYFVNYTTLAGVLGKVVNVLSTFAWNFNDIFVMSISVALSSRFRQLNEHMRRAAKQPRTVQFWMECRISFRNLCKLCDAVDDAIASITLLCFSNNLYFICGKILRSLQKKPSFTHALYFWFSLVFLLVRTFVLSLYASEINEESRRPLAIFRRVSRAYWCSELRRFSEEVTTDVVALTGMKFFNLTRGLILSVAGTIVTYELVLLQFYKHDSVNDCIGV